PTTAREPWFFPVPVEVVPGSELRLLDVAPDRPPPPPPRHMSRWRTLGIAVMTVGLSLFMLALLSTQGGGRVRLTTDPTAVPAGWFDYTDPDTGFRVSRPPGWEVTDLGTVTDFRDPQSGAMFRVDTAAPLDESPHRTWQRVERAFAAHTPDYRRVRLVDTTFQERPASIWEYRYNENGRQIQVVQLGFYSGDRPVVLRFQAAARDWTDHQPDLAAFEASFRTPR
ncbi:MAG: DUF1795 domain-containing protein, partial [Actinomycetota bacterium]|nr:DUF1795 domain-containing protein [Actinomycetota bacterium]